MSVRSPVVTVSRALSLVIALMAVPAAVAVAEPIAKPTGPVVLTITGAIAETNAPGKAEFDQAMLDALGADTVKTSTEWTEGKPSWEGVRLSRVLDAVGAKGTAVLATALNDYSGEIGMDVIRDYPVLLATGMNGEPLAADKGPIWIIYPIDDYPELLERDDLLWAWQLATVDVR
jgi:hypothetical protein